MSIVKLAGLKSLWNKVTRNAVNKSLISENEGLVKQLTHQKAVTERTKDYARYKGKELARKGLIYGSLGGGALAASSYAYGKNKKKD